MNSKIPRVIIPLAIGEWLLAILAFGVGLPSPVSLVLTVVLIATMFIGVPLVVFYLIADTGWTALARQFRALEPFRGEWTTVATAQIAPVSLHSEEARRMKTRFTGMLRAGVTDDALYLSTLFTRVPVIGRFFPTLRISWRDVTRATRYEAPGWVASKPAAGAVTATYDPNYTGAFVELEVGEPRTFIDLPLAVLGAASSNLTLEEPA